MRWIFAAVVLVHALIHLLGFLKAFELAAIPQLKQPISPELGILWLVAGLSLLATSVSLFAWPRGYWLVGALALVLSQVAIGSAWSEAKFGTLANVVLSIGVLYGFLTQGPTSFRAEFAAQAGAGLARAQLAATPALLTEADLAPLPAPVQRYLRATGALGQPRVVSYRVRFRGRIRGSPSDAWMKFTAQQQSFTDPPARLFLMRATKLGVPAQVFHRLVNGAATMQVKLAGMVTLVDARGPVMDRTEAVTLFNDMCVLAPASLVSPHIVWQPIDDRAARAHFTYGSNTISAMLHFDPAGLLADFVSDDRSRASADGQTFTQLRFSTPLREYRQYGPVRLASHGEARWHAPEGDFTYGEFELLELSYNQTTPP